jgi:prepilin-type N-terminal cleavage/methylation domain-containing protein
VIKQFTIWKKIVNSQWSIVNRQPGFTLIEISIVISILAIISTAGLASFVNYSRTQALQTSASELATTLNLAKSRAFSQVKPPECSAQPLNGYKVVISEIMNTFELDAVCSGNNSIPIQTRPLSKGVTFSISDTSSTSFLFPVISGGVVGSGKVVITGFGMKKTITVDSIGNVK